MYYLYIKTHNQTGLKYLGITTNEDPHNYPGSGTYWTKHLKNHGYDYKTEILFETPIKDELKEHGLYYSNLWNIVESKLWANLMPEAGEICMNPATAKKISETMKGRPAHNKGLKQKHKKHKTSHQANYKGSNGKLRGRVRPRLDCPHCGKNIDEANIHRYHGDNCKSKI